MEVSTMITQEDADLTLEAYDNELINKNKNISYLAVVEELDDNKNPTGSFEIEVGISSDIKVYHSSANNSLPTELKVPARNNKQQSIEKYVNVRIAISEKITIQNFTAKERPLKGGCSISPYNSQDVGTLGGSIKIENNNNDFFISNQHVLNGEEGDPIIQPGSYDGGKFPNDVVGNHYWSKLNIYMDVAIGKVNVSNSIDKQTLCNYNIKGVEEPKLGMKIKKSGRTTGCTTGIIDSVNATIVVEYPSIRRTFKKQIRTTTSMSKRGDSGSIICNSENNKAIGLLFAGSYEHTYANNINMILQEKNFTFRN